MTSPDTIIGGVSARRIAEVRAREAATFTAARPKTEAALRSGASAFLDGVPMLWMKDWPQPFPMVVAEAKGASIVDIDGNRLDDFCFGDTGSMFGHSPAPVAKAIREQAERGLTYMLPTLDALEVGHLLQDRFAPSTGRSPPPQPTRTVSRSALPAPSPVARRSCSSRPATMALSMMRWHAMWMARQSPARALSGRLSTLRSPRRSSSSTTSRRWKRLWPRATWPPFLPSR